MLFVVSYRKQIYLDGSVENTFISGTICHRL